MNLTHSVGLSRRCATGGSNSFFSPEDPEECYAAVSLLIEVVSEAWADAAYVRTVGMINALVRLTFQTAMPAVIW